MEDIYLQCKNSIFEELINFVHLSEDIKKFERVIKSYQESVYTHLKFIHTAECIINTLLKEQDIIRQKIEQLKIQLKDIKKSLKEEKNH
jgi:hypothetical protein